MNREQALKLLNECGTNINSMYEDKVLAFINKALTPPTEQEVCEALSEYYGLMVRYDDRNDVFQKYVGDGDWIVIHIAGLRTEAPHLITLIGRFYEKEVKVMTINDMYNYLLKKGYKPYTLATISVEELKKLYESEAKK